MTLDTERQARARERQQLSFKVEVENKRTTAESHLDFEESSKGFTTGTYAYPAADSLRIEI
jgi:hypothetical protein